MCSDEVDQMEEHRCRIASTEREDARCKSLFEGVVFEMEDRRCKGLKRGTVLETEDPRFDSVAVQMEDPRCNSLRGRW